MKTFFDSSFESIIFKASKFLKQKNIVCIIETVLDFDYN
jgi:hypothetical protein